MSNDIEAVEVSTLPTPTEMAYTLRDSLLLISDWTQLPDVDLTSEEVAAWRVYRQELRDLPAASDWPDTVFPTAPTN